MLNIPSYVETSIVICCWETIIQFPISLKLAYRPPQRRLCQILNRAWKITLWYSTLAGWKIPELDGGLYHLVMTLPVRHGKIHHAIKCRKPSISII